MDNNQNTQQIDCFEVHNRGEMPATILASDGNNKDQMKNIMEAPTN